MTEKRNAIIALLKIYKKQLEDFSNLIQNFDDDCLPEITDTTTERPECKSRQAIIAHVISSGYTYATYIRKIKNIPGEFRKVKLETSVKKFLQHLEFMFNYTEESLQHFVDEELEETDPAKKIHAHWNKEYDIEQILEHAIVHVMRHSKGLQALAK